MRTLGLRRPLILGHSWGTLVTLAAGLEHPGYVRGLVLGEGLRLAGLGAAIGLAGAVVANRLLRGLLFGVHPLDPVSLLAAALLLVGVSALASYVPARRAARADPVSMLRAE